MEEKKMKSAYPKNIHRRFAYAQGYASFIFFMCQWSSCLIQANWFYLYSMSGLRYSLHSRIALILLVETSS